jgi:hypothetical protein
MALKQQAIFEIHTCDLFTMALDKKYYQVSSIFRSVNCSNDVNHAYFHGTCKEATLLAINISNAAAKI